jgi:hypothetical protein
MPEWILFKTFVCVSSLRLKTQMVTDVSQRVFLTMVALVGPLSVAFVISVFILSAMGLAAALYSISVLSLFMEVSPQGKSGLLAVLRV